MTEAAQIHREEAAAMQGAGQGKYHQAAGNCDR
jgi:hypothetical protein